MNKLREVKPDYTLAVFYFLFGMVFFGIIWKSVVEHYPSAWYMFYGILLWSCFLHFLNKSLVKLFGLEEDE